MSATSSAASCWRASVSERLRVPTDCRELAEVVAREHGNVHRSGEFGAAPLVRLLERCDAFRKPARFDEILLACECDARGRLGLADAPYPQRQRLLAVQAAATERWTRPTSPPPPRRAASAGPAIGAAVHEARVRAVEALLAG